MWRALLECTQLKTVEGQTTLADEIFADINKQDKRVINYQALPYWANQQGMKNSGLSEFGECLYKLGKV